MHKNPFKERISRDKVLCSMQNIPFIDTTKMLCHEGDKQGRYITETPCVTEDMVDYVYWGVNEALRCFADYIDDNIQDVIYRKIHLESSFGFFFKSINGTGLTQMVGPAKTAMFTKDQPGYEFLKNHIMTHPQQCSSFIDLIKRSETTKNLGNCDFISIGDGIGRNLIGGIGLYIHYRSDPNNKFSAENILKSWGYKNTHSTFYYKARASLASGMYNRGIGAVYNEIHDKYSEGSLAEFPEFKKYKSVMNTFRHSMFAGYLKDMGVSPAAIFKNGQCTIASKVKPTFDGLAYQHSEPPLSSLLIEWGEHGTSARYLHWKR
jgi:hypothetical protein